jgi:pimeloyl-ACP methyl ester carboxylesterase
VDEPTVDEPGVVAEWETRGRVLALPMGNVWVLDQPAADDAGLDPVLVLHGFPTCSFDWRHVLPALNRRRRVVLFDFPGFGLSAKPDRRYRLRDQADVAEAVCRTLGLERIALVTHDMGDSIGGELLARDLEGALSLQVTGRVLTNGSIYLDLARLTPGQLFLLDLPDARAEPRAGTADDGAAMRAALAATCAPARQPGSDELAAQWALIARNRGHHLLPRTIRYIEDRRVDEARFTGAIERHPSPLGVVWGAEDPIAVVAMADRLGRRRPELGDRDVVVLDGVGHYPMIEDPVRFTAATLGFLDATPGMPGVQEAPQRV